MTLYGWDASDFDWSRGSMNIKAAYDDGIRVFTHKATEGTVKRHARTGEALARAKAAGIPYLGVYVVPRTPGNSGNGTVAQQVAYLMAYVNEAAPWWRTHPGFFFQVDLEHWSNAKGVYDAVAPVVGVEMVRLIRAATGRPVVLYAPKWAYGNTIGGDAPLWQSAYGSNPALPYRRAYAAAGGDKASGWAAYSGRVPLVLQFGSRTTIGTQNTCDANAIRDEAAWERLFQGGDPFMALTDAEQKELLQLARDTFDNVRAGNEGAFPNGQPYNQAYMDGSGGVSHVALGRMLTQLLDEARADAARDKATQVQLDAALVALQALATSGGSDIAPAVAAIREVGAQVQQMQQENHELRGRLAAALGQG